MTKDKNEQKAEERKAMRARQEKDEVSGLFQLLKGGFTSDSMHCIDYCRC